MSWRRLRLHKARVKAIFDYSHRMSVTLPLHEMTVPEKLRLMEAIWEDLTRNSDTFESPAWHEAELRKREERIASGQATFIDWERAKTEIRQQVT